MKSLADFFGTPLAWVEPHAMKSEYELRTEKDEVLGTLKFRSPWGSLAVAETAHGSWSFKRVGFLNPHVTVRAPEAESDLAVYRPKLFGGGELAFADGASSLWTPANVWQTRWAFQDAAGQAVVEFAPGPPSRGISGLFKTEAAVTVLASAGLAADRAAQMAALGFYLMILHKRDAGSAGAVVAATASS